MRARQTDPERAEADGSIPGLSKSWASCSHCIVAGASLICLDMLDGASRPLEAYYFGPPQKAAAVETVAPVVNTVAVIVIAPGPAQIALGIWQMRFRDRRG